MGNVFGPIETTPKSDRTYNSSTIYSFTWRPRDGSDEFNKGELIVKFRQNPDNPDDEPTPPSSAYAYNVPKEAFDRMKYLALNVSQDDPEMTAGEWFSNRFSRYIDWEDRKNGDLYLRKMEM